MENNTNTIVTLDPIAMYEAEKNVTVVESKEEVTMTENTVVLTADVDVAKATVKELKELAKTMGIKIPKGSKKTDIVALIDSVEVVSDPVEVEPEKEETAMDKKEDAKLGKWDKLVEAVSKEYVNQSLNKSWALFYKSTKVDAHKGEYMVKTSKLFGATGKAIEGLYGKKHNNLSNIQQILNVMVVRGYLNFEIKTGTKHEKNVVFYATKDQMNEMFKISR